MGKEKELIRRGVDNTVNATGKRGRGGAKGQGRDPDKALAEDQGSTPAGRGEGQSPRVVAGGARPT